MVNIISRVFDWTEALPIRSVKLTFPEGKPQWDVAASQSIDQPWSTFEWLPIDLPDVSIPDTHIGLGWFDPCGPFDVICREDNFSRTVASGFGSPSDGGSAWSVLTGVLQNGVSVDPGYGHMLSHGSFTASAHTVGHWTVLLDTSGCLDADEMDMYVRIHTQASIRSDGDPFYDTGSDYWALDTSVARDTFSIAYGDGLGRNVMLAGNSSGWLQLALGRTGTAYYYPPFNIGFLSYAYSHDLIVHIHCEASVTSVSVYRDIDPEPAYQLSKDVFTHSTGSSTEFGSGIVIDSTVDVPVGHSVLAQQIDMRSLTIRRTYSGTGSCIDTFTRTVSGGWGTSEIGPDWSTYGTVEVDGAEARSTAFGAGTLPLDGWSLPVEILVLCKNEDFPLSQTQIAMGVFSDSSHGLQWGYNSPILGSNDLVLAAFDASGTQIMSYTYGSTGLDDTLSNQWVWMRARFDGSGGHARMWLDGDAEPGSWQVEAPWLAEPTAGDIATWSLLQFSMNAGDSDGGWNDLSQLEIISGLECDPCSGPTPPPADPPTGNFCQTILPLTSPPDSSYQYFDTGGLFIPGSSECTAVTLGIGGLFLTPGTDYVEFPTLGYIGIDNGYDLTGKNIWFCATYQT